MTNARCKCKKNSNSHHSIASQTSFVLQSLHFHAFRSFKSLKGTCFISRTKNIYLLFCPQDTLFSTRNRFLLSPANEKQQNFTEKDNNPCNWSETSKIETKQIRRMFKITQWVRKTFTHLVGIIETVIHKSGNQWRLSHCKIEWKVNRLLSKHYEYLWTKAAGIQVTSSQWHFYITFIANTFFLNAEGKVATNYIIKCLFHKAIPKARL